MEPPSTGTLSQESAVCHLAASFLFVLKSLTTPRRFACVFQCSPEREVLEDCLLLWARAETHPGQKYQVGRRIKTSLLLSEVIVHREKRL